VLGRGFFVRARVSTTLGFFQGPGLTTLGFFVGPGLTTLGFFQGPGLTTLGFFVGPGLTTLGFFVGPGLTTLGWGYRRGKGAAHSTRELLDHSWMSSSPCT